MPEISPFKIEFTCRLLCHIQSSYPAAARLTSFQLWWSVLKQTFQTLQVWVTREKSALHFLWTDLTGFHCTFWWILRCKSIIHDNQSSVDNIRFIWKIKKHSHCCTLTIGKLNWFCENNMFNRMPYNGNVMFRQ